jgi:hypothetical protein
VGVFGTSAGTEPLVDGYLRGQVFNREVPEVEDLYYRALRLSSGGSVGVGGDLWATNSQLPNVSDANGLAGLGLNLISISSGNFGGAPWPYGMGKPRNQENIYYQNPEYLDSKKAVRELFTIYGFRYLVYTGTYNGLTEISFNRPIPAPPSSILVEQRLELLKRLKGNKFQLKKLVTEISGYGSWQLFEYPPTDPFNAGGWFFYANAVIALELDVTTGATRQIPRTP